jgi:pSer/pThr/pTyr-binding forkhead associated (FHA) protein
VKPAVPPIVLFALQALVLLLLYLFVARAVRAVIRDVRRDAPSRRAAPSPPASRPGARTGSASQLVVHRPEARPELVALDGNEIRFGRSRDCDIVLTDDFVSERHARVFPRQGAWMIADMGSTNGTYLNRQRVNEASQITVGDQVTIGKTIVEVRR